MTEINKFSQQIRQLDLSKYLDEGYANFKTPEDGNIFQIFDSSKAKESLNDKQLVEEFKNDTKGAASALKRKYDKQGIKADNYLSSQFDSMKAMDWGERSIAKNIAKKAGDYDKNHATSFNGAKQYSTGAPDIKPQDKLNTKQTVDFLKSDDAKSLVKELGINTNNISNDGKVSVDGKTYNVEIDKTNGTLRFKDTDSNNTLDLKLGSKEKDAAKKAGEKFEKPEMETVKTYNIKNGQKLELEENYNKDKKPGEKIDLYKDGMSYLLNNSVYNPDHQLEGQLKGMADGQEIEYNGTSNAATWTDKNGIEHQAYFDMNSKQFVEAEKKPDGKGGYDVKVKMHKNDGVSDTSSAQGKKEIDYKDVGNLNSQFKGTQFEGEKISETPMKDMLNDVRNQEKIRDELHLNPNDLKMDGNDNKAYLPGNPERQVFFTDKGKVVVVDVDNKNHKASIVNAKIKGPDGKEGIATTKEGKSDYNAGDAKDYLAQYSNSGSVYDQKHNLGEFKIKDNKVREEVQNKLKNMKLEDMEKYIASAWSADDTSKYLGGFEKDYGKNPEKESILRNFEQTIRNNYNDKLSQLTKQYDEAKTDSERAQINKDINEIMQKFKIK